MKQGVLYLDPRAGSGRDAGRRKSLEEPLRHVGVPVKLQQLESADVAFLGTGGPGCRPKRIGIEIKAFGDFYASLRSGRLAGSQLAKLVKQYHRSYLILEGIWRPMPNGLIGLRQGKLWRTSWFRGSQGLRFAELHGHLMTLLERAGVHWERTTSQWETVLHIAEIYRWWQKEKHRSHLAFHRDVDPAILSRPSLTRLWAKELPGVGWDRAIAIDAHFQSCQELALADEQEWRQVPGIGRTLASRIVRAIEERRRPSRQSRGGA